MDIAHIKKKEFRKRDIPPHLLKYFQFKRANRWILRNKIKWAKQVLLKKENRTIGSVMPTSVKDRFNESGEELYFFVKNKKYYSNLDVVRLLHSKTTWQRLQYPFNPTKGDVQSAVKYTGLRSFQKRMLAGQPQFKASEEEIKSYKKQDNVPSRNAQMYAGFNERWKNRNKVNDPRGTHEGGPGSWRDFKDNPANSFRNYQKERQTREQRGVSGTVMGPTGFDHNLLNNPSGKNICSVWQINPEPHNFQKELGVKTEHFAVFPEALCDIPIRFGCPLKGVVLDPFCGSGTALLVAKKLGRNYIGIDISQGYCEIAEKRLAAVPESLI
ncbi:MAG: site-specific DNA-methyltransferase [Candidatus Moranbacteria bacterium]|nr:site-specific DNA-methyltransferase [Candidatus Moranbacteria bacterium]